MPRIFSTLLIALGVCVPVFLSSGRCFAAGGTKHFFIQEAEEARINKVIENRFTPGVAGVRIVPPAPRGDEPFDVYAELDKADAKDDGVAAVFIYYTTDYGTRWKQLRMAPGEGGVWKASLPGQVQGVVVTYGFRVVTKSGNAYVEAVCDQEASPAESKLFMEGGCAAGGCDDPMPRDCMFPMAGDVAPLDDDPADSPPGLDIVDYRVGFDVNKVYVDYTFEGGAATDAMILYKEQLIIFMPSSDKLENKQTVLDGIPGQVARLSTSVPNSYAILDQFWRPSPLFTTGMIFRNDERCGNNVDRIFCGGGFARYAPAQKGECGFDYMSNYGEVINDKSGVQCKNTANHLTFELQRGGGRLEPDELLLYNMSSIVADSIMAATYSYGTQTLFDTVNSDSIIKDRILSGFSNYAKFMETRITSFEGISYPNTTTLNNGAYSHYKQGKIYDLSGFTRVKFLPRTLIIN